MQETKSNTVGEEGFYAGLTKSQICAIAHKNTDNTVQFERKLRSRFSHALPTGVLAVHVKHYNDIRINELEEFIGKPGVCMYLRIQVGDQHRDVPTHFVDNNVEHVAVDCIRHFSVTVHNNREDAAHIKFVLIAYQEFDKQEILSKYDLHIYDIIKKPFMSETFEFMKDHHMLATADVEIAFAHGDFGYGWSNQLQNPVKTPASQVTHSMFYRQEPPPERSLENIADIASALPIGHPPFIPFTVKADIGKTAKDLDTEIDVKELTRTISDPLILVSKTRKRMGALLDHYTKLTSRKDRIDFLSRLVNERSASDYAREKGVMEQERDGEHDAPPARNNLIIPHLHVASDEDLPTMTKIMANAPAIRPRNIGYREPPPRTDDVEEEATVTVDVEPTPQAETSQARTSTRAKWGRVKNRLTNVLGAFGMLGRPAVPAVVVEPPAWRGTKVAPLDDEAGPNNSKDGRGREEDGHN